MGTDLEPWEEGYDDIPRLIDSDNPTMLNRYADHPGEVTVAFHVRCLLATGGPDYWRMGEGFWDMVADTVF